MLEPVEQARQSYAEELRFTARVNSSAVVNAFAAVPRHQFVGPGPWRIKSPMDLAEYWTTDDNSPKHVYHDVLIALDESRGINNGQPSLWAYLFDHLEPSAERAGTPSRLWYRLLHSHYCRACWLSRAGYRSRNRREAGPEGGNSAHQLVSGQVIQADGAGTSFEPVDAIVASAGATHPLASWLDALRPGGRLLFPMTTVQYGPGEMLLVTRRSDLAFASRFIRPAGFIDFQGARDPATSHRLAAALHRDGGAAVKSLRRDSHREGETCWLHGDDWCLSRGDPDED